MYESKIHLREKEYIQKLQYISLRWNINEQFLRDVLMRDPLPGIKQTKKRRFRKQLKSLESIFENLSLRYKIEDKFKIDPFLRDYCLQIKRSLNNDEIKYLQYLNGNWDDEILRVVSIAQKEHMIPKRIPTKQQDNPKISLEPRSEYSSNINR